jgi:hypothetical protein
MTYKLLHMDQAIHNNTWYFYEFYGGFSVDMFNLLFLPAGPFVRSGFAAAYAHVLVICYRSNTTKKLFIAFYVK